MDWKKGGRNLDHGTTLVLGQNAICGKHSSANPSIVALQAGCPGDWRSRSAILTMVKQLLPDSLHFSELGSRITLDSAACGGEEM